MGQVLAAQRQHQHGTGVGVAGQRGQQLAGLRVVMAGLGAAERMGEGVQPVNAVGHKILIVPHKGFGAVVHAANGGDDPNLVAGGCTAILAAVDVFSVPRQLLHLSFYQNHDGKYKAISFRIGSRTSGYPCSERKT